MRHWAEWAVKEFPESSFDPRSNDWDIEGSQLVELSHEDFKSKVLFQIKQIQLIDSSLHLVYFWLKPYEQHLKMLTLF